MAAGTADDEFLSALCSVHSKTLSQTAFHRGLGAGIRATSSTAATMIL